MRRNDIDELKLIQEQQNHRDAVLASHMAMDQLKITLAKVQYDHRSQCVFLTNQISKNESEIKNVKETFLEIYKDQQRQINDLKNDNIKHKTRCLELECDKESLQNQIKESMKLLDKSSRESEIVKKDHIEKYSNLKHVVDKNKLKSREEINKFQETILNRPSEYKMLKDYIDSKLQEKQIDHDGIYSNIEFFKGKYKIVDKKIENIYTLIERMGKK